MGGIFGKIYQQMQEPEPKHNPVHATDRQQVTSIIYEAVVDGGLDELGWSRLLEAARSYNAKYNLEEELERWLLRSQRPVFSMQDVLQLKNWADSCPWPDPNAPAQAPTSVDPFRKFRL
jgi:hypothetical protein